MYTSRKVIINGTYNSAGVGMSFKCGPGMISVTGKGMQRI
jgi:hypothetical protein